MTRLFFLSRTESINYLTKIRNGKNTSKGDAYVRGVKTLGPAQAAHLYKSKSINLYVHIREAANRLLEGNMWQKIKGT